MGRKLHLRRLTCLFQIICICLRYAGWNEWDTKWGWGRTHIYTYIQNCEKNSAHRKKNYTTNNMYSMVSGELWSQAVYLYDVVIWYSRSEVAQTEGSSKKVDWNGVWWWWCVHVCVFVGVRIHLYLPMQKHKHTHTHNKHEIPLNIMNRTVSMVVHYFQFDFCNSYISVQANRPKRSTIRSRLSHGTFHFIKCECV